MMRLEPPTATPKGFPARPLPSAFSDMSALPGCSQARGANEAGGGASDRAEGKLLRRIFQRCHAHITEACKLSSISPEFLAALTASESGGDPRVVRFEPAVYRHLRAVADGHDSIYGGIGARALAAEFQDILHPKASDYHAQHLTRDFSANHRQELSALDDEAIRELASSWGFTQIMGYHMVGRRGTVHDLLNPAFHYHVALQLLSEFAHDYQLDLTCEHEELISCWNTGRPYGKTADPAYAEKGLRRMGLYRSLWIEEPLLAESQFRNARGN